MNCLNCPSILAPDAIYCSICGASVKRSRTTSRYAGFWWRVLAVMLDLVILFPVLVAVRVLFPRDPAGADDYVMTRLAGHPGSIQDALPWMRDIAGYVEAVYFTLALYYIPLESSKMQGTLGKYLLGLQVTDLDGRRVRPGRAIKRYLARLLAALPWQFGFVMAGFTRRKQGLHDMVAGTLVVRKPSAGLF